MDKIFKTFVLLCISTVRSTPVYYNNNTRDFQVDSADAHLTVPQLIKKYGYSVEQHHVVTEDGYILELHRIPGKNGSLPVFLMHGLLCSSADWVLAGPKDALAYLLADKGYDVWLGNARGNTYSRAHLTLTPNMFAFWQFSWHEIGFYDLPAMIDYVLNHTKHRKLHYIGHSQGTTTFYVMASTRPDYNDKIHLMQALAPVAYTEHIRSPLLRVMSRFQDTLTVLFEIFGIAEFHPNNAILHEIANLLCTSSAVNNLCLNVLFQLAGADPEQIDLKLIPILVGHTPAGAATKQIAHFAQGIRSRLFRRYDHGKIKNLFVYGTPTPPVYNLTQITAPVLVYYALNDFLASPADVDRLSAEIPNLVERLQVAHGKFNHLDFLFAKNVKELLYDEVIRRISL
ncbi:lipase 1-like [Sabethes cyaneus]|uniref:lipase 1-like n=1 Tax=Sabethes cyaneus TaxID=53552 RepID=UPI00237D9E3A|nr:lipase 1-like [Sabethes cyaneus]